MNFDDLNTYRLPKRNLLIASVLLFFLSFASAIFFQKKPLIGQERNRLQRYIRYQQSEFEKIAGDSVLMHKLVEQRPSASEYESLAEKKFGFFLYVEPIPKEQELLFWNSQKILPPVDSTSNDSLYNDREEYKYVENGFYLIQKKTLSNMGFNRRVTAYAMVPVFNQYYVETKYLRKNFEYDKNAVDKIRFSDAKTPYGVYSLHNKLLFYITGKANTTSDPITVTLRIAACILMLLFIHFFSEVIIQRKGTVVATIFIVTLLLSVRLFVYLYSDVFYLSEFVLFNNRISGATWFSRSLGDLLLNTILGCWLFVFIWQHIIAMRPLPHFLSGKKLVAAAVMALFIYILATFELASIVQSLVISSVTSFDVTNFFSLNTFSLIGFVVLALLSLGYYYFTRLLFWLILPAFQNPIYIYFLISLLGLIFLTLPAGYNVVLFQLPVLGWLMIYTFLFTREQFFVNRFKITVAGVLFWIFIFSISLAILIFQANRDKEWEKRKNFARKIYELTDPSSGETLRIALMYLDNNFLLNNFTRFADLQQNEKLRDSIINESLSSYNRKYNTKIFVFDAKNKSINNNDTTSFPTLNTIFSVQSKYTGTQDLYYHETSFDRFTYITKRAIQDSAGQIGTFFMLFSLKQYPFDALSPELFRSVNQKDNEDTSSSYSYAIYNDRKLSASSNVSSSSINYPFVINLSNSLPREEFNRFNKDEYDELWYRASTSKIIVVAKKQDYILEIITLFSYIFLAFLLMIIALRFLVFLVRTGRDWRTIHQFWQFSIRSQVHSTIIFISLLSFTIIGITTISFFISRYNRNNVDRLSRTARIMIKEMEKQLVTDSTFTDSSANYNLQQLVNDIADIHDVDINVYNTNGDLKLFSEKNLYKFGVLSYKMNPIAFYHLNKRDEVQFVQKEAMSTLKYWSVYVAVRNENGKVYSYLNIPSFASQIELEQDISNFLVTIINLNAFIFIIAGIIALFITNKITRSFSVIGDKMKEITLGKTNEEILWNRNDEIGQLVEQYNKMVHQLEESADALARSEREGAWREMARQVAHEIKNPLTPMKLSIQYLQRAIYNNQPNVKELTGSVANTLIEQIDHLSKIAADFSQFAHIGTKKIEVFDLHTVLSGLIDLYASNPKVRVVWDTIEEPVMLEADKTHMNRLFTNLFTNAIDACAAKQKCIIECIEEKDEDSILIKIKDNGEGIPEEMHSKIFTPNFTTKSSGTGLGLAMCKSIVEQAGGHIWFETQLNEGTTFFVRLPVID